MKLLAVLLALHPVSQDAAALIERLRSDSPEVREAAARELQGLGPRAIPALEKAAGDPDAEVAGRARRAIRAIRIEERLSPALRAKKPDALPRLVNGDDPVWTTLLMELLSNERGPDLPEGLGRKDVEPLLEPALRNAGHDTNRPAPGDPGLHLINAISRLGLRAAAPDLVRLIGSEDNYAFFSVANAALVCFDATEQVPAISAHLGSADEQVRRNTADLLGRLGDPSAVPALRGALRDPEETVRKAALLSLGALRDPEIGPELRACLKDPDFLTRAGALDRVGERGDPAEAAHVVPLLADGNSFIQARAAKVLARLGAKDAVPPLIARLDDRDRGVRKAAAEALGRLGDVRAVPRLIEALQDDLTVSEAARALGRLGDPRALPGLAALLAKPPDPESLREAAEALADLGAKEGVAELLKVALHGDISAAWSAMDALAARRAREIVPDLLAAARSATDSTRRSHAVHLLGRLHAREAAPLLRDLLRERALLWAVTESFGRIGSDLPHAELVTLLGDPEEGIHDRAAGALIGADASEAIPGVLKLLTHPKPERRASAAWVLGELRAAEATEGLRKLLEDPSLHVRAGAAYALASLEDREVIPRLAPFLASDEWRAVWFASRAAVVLQAKDTVDDLARLLDDDRAWHRECAAEALGRLGARDHAPAIRRLLHDPGPEVRLAAIQALDALEAWEAAPDIRKRLGSDSEAAALFPPEAERQAAAAFLCHAGSREGVPVVRDSFAGLLSLNALRAPEPFARWRRARVPSARSDTVEALLRFLAARVGVRLELPVDPAWLAERRRIPATTSAAEALGLILERTHGAVVESDVIRILPRPAVRAFWRAWAPVDPPADLGEALWAWGWAGDRGEHLELEDGPKGKLIRRMTDLSGRGHHFLGGRDSKPAYQAGLELAPAAKGGPYKTSLPVIGLDRYRNGAQVYGNVFRWEKPFEAKAGFYLAAACLNTRDGGLRELFGTDGRNCVRLDQERDRIEIVLAGERRVLGAVPKGLLVLELWRDDDGLLGCRVNGSGIAPPGAALPGAFTLGGLGFDGEGSSQWDDVWMEFVVCDRLPPAAKRDACGEHLRRKWRHGG